MRNKITNIRGERQKITRQLEAATSQLETGRRVFLTALDLLDNPTAMYGRGNETVRSILNRAFFTRLYVDGGTVTDQELNEPFDTLNEAHTIYQRHHQERHQGEPGQRHGLLSPQGRDSPHERPGSYRGPLGTTGRA